MPSIDGTGRFKGGRGLKTPLPLRISASHKGDARAAARAILRGEMENIGLPTLLTILDMERRTGMLLVQRERTLGRIHVREGRVVRARIEGTRRGDGNLACGAEAIYLMLTWSDGQFELWQTQPELLDGKDEVGESTTYLLMEGARRVDEARGVIPRPDTTGAALQDGW
jgi:hypothetical protein